MAPILLAAAAENMRPWESPYFRLSIVFLHINIFLRLFRFFILVVFTLKFTHDLGLGGHTHDFTPLEKVSRRLQSDQHGMITEQTCRQEACYQVKRYCKAVQSDQAFAW